MATIVAPPRPASRAREQASIGNNAALAEELADAGFVLDRTWRSTSSSDGHVKDDDFGLILARRI